MLTQSFRKCFVFNFFLSLFLVGCGGGDSGTAASTNPPTSGSASNTAPTLSGVFSVEARAENTSLLIINADDKENDPLHINVSNKPDWLSVELKDGQVAITTKPGFFDIAEYKLTLSISDGKLSREYPLSISVVDNPSKWLTQNISSKDLIGSWQIDDGSRLYIYPNGSGTFISNDNKFTPLKWISDDSTFISLEAPDHNCAGCTMEFPITAIAKKPGYLRLKINNSATSGNAKKLSFTNALDGDYPALYNQLNGGTYSQVSDNGKKLSIKASVELNINLEYSTRHLIHSLSFSAQLNRTEESSADFALKDSTSPTLIMLFYNQTTSKSEQLTFKPKISNVELIPSAATDLITHVRYKLILAGNSENIDITNYEPALANFLAQEKNIYHESIKSNVTLTPKIVAGDKYYLPNAAGRWNGITYATIDSQSSATTLIFETASKGYVLLEGALFTESQKMPFTWSSTDKTLAVAFDNGLSPISYTFAIEDGNLFAFKAQNQTYGPAIKAADDLLVQHSAGFYFGNTAHKGDYYIYQYMYLGSAPQRGISLTTSDDKRAGGPYNYKIENDSSITFLISICGDYDFALCEEEQKVKLANNTANTTLAYVNYKAIAKNGDRYSFLQTRYTTTTTGKSISQSIVNLSYDEFGSQH